LLLLLLPSCVRNLSSLNGRVAVANHYINGHFRNLHWR
jgi:hypothetical protein